MDGAFNGHGLNDPIGMELLSYKPNDERFDSVSVEMGRPVVMT